MIIAQVLKVSNDLVKVVYIVSQVPWNHPLNVRIGNDLEFSSSQQPFTPHTKRKVISTKIYDFLSQIFTLNSSINININDYVVISDTPKVFINNLTIVNNRARGILLETRNVYIKNSIFNRTSEPAILFQPSLSWHEGPYPINITFTQNLYLNNNEGISKNKGAITILSDPIQFNSFQLLQMFQ